MQISKTTIQILKNFAEINTNLLVRPGSTLATISAAQSQFATANVEEDFPVEFAVYDINSLLSLLSLSDGADIEFGDKSLTITKDSGTFEYYYTDPAVIIAPPNKSIVVDEHFVFTLSKEDITTLTKSIGIIGAKMISFVSENGEVNMVVGDPKTPASNSYKKPIGQFESEFNLSLDVAKFTVIAETYEVVLSKKKFVHFRNNERGLKYWFACEKTSTI